MKKTVLSAALGILLVLILAAAGLSIESGAARTMTGKVIGVDDAGKGLSISSMAGGKEIVAGAIVTNETDIRVKGKKAELSQIKPGDRVTMTYVYQNNELYATKVTKK